jgi:hypothetical protein
MSATAHLREHDPVPVRVRLRPDDFDEMWSNYIRVEALAWGTKRERRFLSEWIQTENNEWLYHTLDGQKFLRAVREHEPLVFVLPQSVREVPRCEAIPETTLLTSDEQISTWNRKYWLASGKPRILGGHKNLGWANVGHHPADCSCDRSVRFQDGIFAEDIGRNYGGSGMPPAQWNDLSTFEAALKFANDVDDLGEPSLPVTHVDEIIETHLTGVIAGTGAPLSSCDWIGSGKYRNEEGPSRLRLV